MAFRAAIMFHQWMLPSLSLSSLTRAAFQLHRADADGDGPVQAAEDPEAEQRPHLLFPLPDPARPQVHSLSQRVAS